ncbi:HAUS augmin-like complex subunit 1 isoform X2 [Rissa tridactyla]|uniref:HAUS augmin-like complex subunit 1 isoform X2 n=1 Tax=Rissa tridactyla TaxID=75485 RepID=UPI0023BA8B65|nr:HAUS augmin-like complex subunit 1 isoform X2 [Rissa tridactyla]
MIFLLFSVCFNNSLSLPPPPPTTIPMRPCGAAAARGGRRDGGGRFKAAGADMEEKLQRIALWLKKIYKNQPIPAFEANKRTVDILYDLAERNEARDRDVSLLIEDKMQKAKEYEAEAKYLQGLLAESLALSLSSLSSKGTSYLDVLVNSAMILETKDTSLVSFFYAINDMTSELYATESKNRQMELELKDRMKKLTGALMLEKQIREDLEKTEKYLEFEMSKAEYQSQKTKFLKDKSKDFKVRIKAAEDQLTATGLHKSLTHESLMSLSEPTREFPWDKCPDTERQPVILFVIRAINRVDIPWTVFCYVATSVLKLLHRMTQELAQLQQETAPVKKKLQSYLDLPPSPLEDNHCCYRVFLLQK